MFFNKSIALSEDEFETFVKRHIAYQINYNNDYLLAYNSAGLLQDKHTIIHVLDLKTFATSIFGISYEINSSSFILQENDGDLKYRLCNSDSKKLIGLHEEFILNLNSDYDDKQEKSAEFTKLCERSFLVIKNNIKKLLVEKDKTKNCSICGFDFQKGKDWKYLHCPNCEELIMYIYKMKDEKTKKENISRKLSKKNGAVLTYCKNLLKNKKISESERYQLLNLLKRTYPKQF